MKRNVNYRLEVFQIILMLLLLLNGIFYNFLYRYYMILFLGICLLLFKVLFGFEKDRHRYSKDVIMNILIYLLTFFIFYYVLGIFISFAKNSGYYSFNGFINYTLRVALYIVLREIFRYYMLCKSEGREINIALSIILFILMDVTNSMYISSFSNKYNIFIFIALSLLPAIGNNLLATYLNVKVGYKPVIFYMLIVSLYVYLLPIIPNPNRYISSIVNFCLPMFLLYREYSFFKKENDEYLERDYNKKHLSLVVFSLILTVVLVYFTSGYFRFHAIAVATGSMQPVIHKGDVVVIEKVDGRYDNLKVGDIIAYKYHNVIVVHRIINIVVDREKYFIYTKGDYNSNSDNWVVEEDMILGVVNLKIPAIGLPTVWINEL